MNAVKHMIDNHMDLATPYYILHSFQKLHKHVTRDVRGKYT